MLSGKRDDDDLGCHLLVPDDQLGLQIDKLCQVFEE